MAVHSQAAGEAVDMPRALVVALARTPAAVASGYARTLAHDALWHTYIGYRHGHSDVVFLRKKRWLH